VPASPAPRRPAPGVQLSALACPEAHFVRSTLLHFAGGTSSPPLHQPNLGEHVDKEYSKVRLQELRDPEGTVLAQGLHPSITVVSASAGARASLLAALPTEEVHVVRASDLDAELARATEVAAARYEHDLEEKRGLVAGARAAAQEARRSMEEAVHEAKVASVELEAFDQLAERLASAEENYEAAVRAQAETARSLATAVSELDRVLAQRQAASDSLNEARKSRDNQGVPEAVLQQALNVQSALSEALTSRREAVEQADATYHDARSAARHALAALEAAHLSLIQGTASYTSPHSSPYTGPAASPHSSPYTSSYDRPFASNGHHQQISGTPGSDLPGLDLSNKPGEGPGAAGGLIGPMQAGQPAPAPGPGPLGPGVPLPGLVGNYRDYLAAHWRSAQAAERRARDAEATARAHLEQQERELEALSSAGATEPPALDVALDWGRNLDLSGTSVLVADDAFKGFGPEGVAALLEAIAERGCQAIYLTEDPAVLSWAIGLPREVGAATAATAPRPKRLALVGG